MKGHEFFPLKNCTSGGIDVILHVPSVNSLQKVRLATLMKLFTSKNDLVRAGNRIALFLNRNLTEPLIGFNRFNKANELLDKLERLPDVEDHNLQQTDVLLSISVEYFHQNYIENWNRTAVIVILCETCTHLEDIKNTFEYLDYANVLIISITEYEITN